MKTNKIILSTATMMALFTACSQDEAAVQTAAPQNGDINLTSQVVPTRAASELQTTALSTSVKVGAFGVVGSSTISNGNNNQYTVESDATLSATANMKWPDATSTVNIYAYAPYQEGWAYNTANSFSVKTDQSADADYLASDLLYAKASSTQTTDVIPLAFTHKLSRINVTVKKSSEATATLNGASVYITNTCTATTLNPSTGALATTPSAVDNIKIGTLSAEPSAEGTTLYGITVPQQLAA
ncbi:MAG: fimbrillin family protein, partial [Prevotella sp.]|nr:fimbrillin family protein [Prevotella sp.]